MGPSPQVTPTAVRCMGKNTNDDSRIGYFLVCHFSLAPWQTTPVTVPYSGP